MRYRYARPGHETLGLNAGLDFETKILVKPAAAKLLRAELNRSSWRGECITLSGITDCYQPAERHYQITRQCLEVLVQSRQAFAIVTKNALVVRDLDLLQQAAAQKTVHVNISVTSLDAQLTRKLEPRTSTPSARLRAIERLAEAGIPVATMVAPVVPGLTDHEMPSILEAVRDAGALAASYQLLRLPSTVLPVFMSWLQSNYPERSALVESRIRTCRGGKLNESEFFQRMKGGGAYAEHVRTTFRTFARRYGLDQGLPSLDTSQFRPPRNAQGQQLLF